ncbi:MAG TPA: class I SAM-dependent methyltransferase [Steroidobacteraceae bacterium]
MTAAPLRILSLSEYIEHVSPGWSGTPRSLDACELCQGRSLECVATTCRVNNDLRVGYPVMSCRECGLLFQGLRFPDNFYHNYYARTYKASVLPPEHTANYIEDQKTRGNYLYQALMPHLGPSGRVLDIGCSFGGLLVAFRNAGWEPFGCDPDIGSVETGREQLGLNLTVQSAEFLDYRDEFDLVIITGSLEHVADLERSIGQSLLALKEGGLILIEGWALAQAAITGQFGHNQKRYFNQQSLRSLFRLHGIENVFIRREDLCGPSRPGSTFALGRRNAVLKTARPALV